MNDSFVASIIITAVEGGINYWAYVAQYEYQDKFFGDSEDSARAKVLDRETVRPYVVTMQTMRAAIAQASEGDVEYLSPDSQRLAQGDDTALDSVTADQLFQLAAFGEIIYG